MRVDGGAGPEPGPLGEADELATQLVRLIRLLDRTQAAHLARTPNAVDRPAYLLLVCLVKGGPQRVGGLAEAVHSDPSTVSRQIGQLVRLGLVERTADPRDGRATLLAATAEGRRVFEENRRNRNERVAEMIGDWVPEDRRTLITLLGRFTSAMEQVLSATPRERPR